MSCKYRYKGKTYTKSELENIYDQKVNENFTQSELDDITDSNIDFTVTSNLIIPGVPIKVSNLLTDNIVSDLMEILITEGDQKMTNEDINEIVEDNISFIQDKINKLTPMLSKVDGVKKSKLENLLKLLNNIVNNKKQVKSLVKAQLQTYGIIKVKESQSQEDEVKSELATDQSNYERTDFGDGFSLQVDSKHTASVNLKKFLIGIKEKSKSEDGSIVESQDKFLGQYGETIPFDKVYNTLHGILGNMTEASFDEVIATLKGYVQINDSNLWVQDVINRLEKAPSSVQNEFVTDMYKHYVNMVKASFESQTKAGKISTVLRYIEDNSNSALRLQVGNWKNNVLGGEHVNIQEDEAATLSYEGLNIVPNTITPLELKEVLQRFGIDMTLDTVKKIDAAPINYGRTTYNIKQVANFINKVIKRTDDVDKIFTDNVFKALAQHQVEYEASEFPASYRSGDKGIYAYSNNKYSTLRHNQLLHNIDGVLDNLSKTHFAKDSLYLNALQQEDSFMKDYWQLNYVSLDTIINKNNKTPQASLNELSPAAHELYKIAMFQSNPNISMKADFDGFKKRKVDMLYMTMSDKSTMLSMTVPAIKILSGESIHVTELDRLYDAVVTPEVERIANLTDNENINLSGYKANLFYMIPQLNDVTIGGKKLTDLIVEHEGLPEFIGKENVKEVIKEELVKVFSGLVNDKVEFWNENKLTELLDANYMKDMKDTKHAAADMVYNYMIHNANILQLFTGDPAQYYKGRTDQSDREQVDATLENFGKRLAGDNATGNDIPITNETKEYIQIFVKDTVSKSETYDYIETVLGKEAAKEYADIEGADAQEFTTWKEHLNILKAIGKITDFEYKQIGTKLRSNEDLNQKELSIVFQPVKPVYVYNVMEDLGGEMKIDNRMYVKSSSFPLLPQLTRGLALDELRIAMGRLEVSSNKTIRLAFKTAVKVGFPKGAKEIYTKNSEGLVDGVKPADELKFSLDDSNVRILDRKGFRIQQDIPYKESKKSITRGSQESKLLFTDILGVTDFISPATGKKVTGTELKAEYEATYDEIFKENYDKLIEDITIDGKLDKVKFAKLLKDEAISRDYDPASIDGIELDSNGDFIIPLEFNPSNQRFQALINSVVYNKIAALKLPGRSYVLGTEDGFQAKSDVETINQYKDGIIWTKKFDGSLKGSHWNGKELTGSQVLLPNFLRDASGKTIPMRNFTKKVDGKIEIDFDKIPKEALKLFGFRIPTQLHSSMSSMEIVGFLPDVAGDLLIASRDFTKQMGSDFDVDKLYAYRYELTGDKDSGYELDSNSKYNKLLDIHFAVLDNPNMKVQKKVLGALGFGELKGKGTQNIASRIDKAKSANKVNVLVSDEYHRMKYINSNQGKIGVAIFSVDSVFNAVSQGTGLQLLELTSDNKYKPLSIQFGDNYEVSDGNLSQEKSLKKGSDRNVSDIVAAYQSASVDNEKEAILEKLNINAETFDVISVLSNLGFEEDVVMALINQPVIVEYTNKLQLLKSGLTETNSDAQDLLIDEMLTKYAFTADDNSADSFYNLTGKDAYSFMFSMIENHDVTDFNNYQNQLLQKFLVIAEHGKTYKKIRTLVNVDSKGIGKKFSETDSLNKRVNDLHDSESIRNFANLYKTPFIKRVIETTLSAHNIMRNSFGTVYKSMVPVSTLIGELTGVKDFNFDMLEKALLSYGINSSIVDNKNVYVSPAFVDKMASTFNHSALQNNDFIKQLRAVNDKSGDIKIVQTTSGINMDKTRQYKGFMELIKSNIILNTDTGYTTKDLAVDLVKHSIAAGGVQEFSQYIKFLPPTFMAQFIDNNYRIDESDAAIQYIRNNPKSTMTVEQANGEVDMPRYTHTVDDKGNVTLMKLTGEGYTPMSKLGKYGFREYGEGLSEKGSVIKANNVYVKASVVNTHTKNESPFLLTVQDSTKDISTIQEGIDALKENGSEYEKVMGEFIGDNISDKIFLQQEDSLYGSGSFNAGLNRLSLSKDKGTYKTFLHELTHAVTIDKIHNPQTRTEKLAVIGLKKAWSKTFKLEVNNPRFQQFLLSYLYDLKTRKNGNLQLRYTENAEFMDMLPTEFKQQVSNTANGAKPDNYVDVRSSEMEDMRAIYGLFNVAEFTAESMTNKEFQSYLNEIPHVDNNKESIWDKVKDLWMKLFGIKKGSVLEAAVKNTILLATNSNEGTENIIKKADNVVKADGNSIGTVSRDMIYKILTKKDLGIQDKVILRNNSNLVSEVKAEMDKNVNNDDIFDIDLGMTYKEYLKSMSKEDRVLMRQLQKDGLIKINCK